MKYEFTGETQLFCGVMLTAIREAPAADVAPVVHCKDCRYFRPEENRRGQAMIYPCAKNL